MTPHRPIGAVVVDKQGQAWQLSVPPWDADNEGRYWSRAGCAEWSREEPDGSLLVYTPDITA